MLSDDPLSAARIEAALRGDGQWQVSVGRASNVVQSVSRDAPGVIILEMSPVRAEHALAALETLPAPPPTILLTSNVPGAWRSRALRRGLHGILARDATAQEIAAAVAAVLAGLLAIHPDALSASPRESRAGEARADAALTSREIEILEMMAEGLGNRSIAARLKISRHTVKFHVASILDKLHASSRTEAVAVGIREGRISV